MKTRNLFLLILVMGLAGCRGPVRDVPVARVGMLAVSEQRPDTTAETSAQQTLVVPAPSAAGICDALRSALQEIPGAEVTIPEAGYEDQSGPRSKSTCRFRVNGTFAALQGTPWPEERIEKALMERGFTQDYRLGADGPDGTSFTMRTDTDSCTIEGRWDGGDDTDPTYVPGDWYEFIVECACDRSREKP